LSVENVKEKAVSTIQYCDGRDGRVVSLGDEEVLVGQHRDCTIRFKDATVERHHARIYKDDGQYWIEDLGSKTGVWVAGTRITRRRLVHRDKVTCGSLVLEYFEK
jgi:pSer/pThr/pTyr-binding forkhead associated (FHA) protein